MLGIDVLLRRFTATLLVSTQISNAIPLYRQQCRRREHVIFNLALRPFSNFIINHYLARCVPVPSYRIPRTTNQHKHSLCWSGRDAEITALSQKRKYPYVLETRFRSQQKVILIMDIVPRRHISDRTTVRTTVSLKHVYHNLEVDSTKHSQQNNPELYLEPHCYHMRLRVRLY